MKGITAVEAVLLARFIAELAPQGVAIVSDAEPRITSLIEHARGVDPNAAPARGGEALLLHMLPAALGIRREQISSAGPYLVPNAEKVRRWREAFANLRRPLIGVAWDEYPPGLLMSMLAPLCENAGTSVSLVFDNARHQLRDWPKAIDGGVHFSDPSDMIAAISCLDMVVATDGLPLHIAGALGVPGVALVACGYPWYLAAGGDRSIWYPSLRIIRQAAPGSWDDVLAQLPDALHAIASVSEPRGLLQ
jgi:hypothetical protein